MRLSLKRYRGLVQIAAALGAILVLVNLGMTLVSAAAPGWLPKKLAGLGFSEGLMRKARSAALDYRAGGIAAEDSLCVVLGLSGASEGIDLGVVAQADRRACRYLGFARAGRNLIDVLDYAAPLHDNGLRPDLVVLAVSPFHMVDGRFNRNDPLGSIPNIDKPGILVPARQRSLADRVWIHDRRRDVSHAIDGALLDARFSLVRAFELDLSRDRVDPWGEMPKLNYPETSTKAFMDWSLNRYRLRGYYDVEAYLQSKAQAGALKELVAGFQDNGAEVVIALMPEHSALRAQVPDAGLTALLQPLNEAFGEQGPAVVDLRASIDDAGFMDIAHLNSRGRDRFSSLLGEIVEQYLPTDDPLMNSSKYLDATP